MPQLNGPFYSPGRYMCEITDQGLTKASTGTVQIALKFRVLEGTQPATTDLQQYERTAYLPVTDKTMQYLVPKLQALGYTRDSIRFIDLSDQRCHDMRGTQAEMFCKHENDQQGQLREKWDVATQSSVLELKPPDAKDIRALDMLFGRQLKANGGPKLTTVPGPKTTEITDDDIPF